MSAIAPIVEGYAEVQSVLVLLRRVLAECGHSDVVVARPFRVSRTRVVRPNEMERATTQTLRSREGVTGVLIVLDADDDCPAGLSPQLRSRAQRVSSVPVEVVFAVRELEAWFLAAKESLRDYKGIRPDASAPPDPEAIRGAKERLSQNMDGRTYLGAHDQAGFADRMDMNAAQQRSPSFAFFLEAVRRLIGPSGPP